MSKVISVTKQLETQVTKQKYGTYHDLAGPIEFGFTNDYMFRAILQKNRKVLKGLVCALLHLHPDEVTSILITNPIEPGDSVDAKEFILDIHVQINQHTMLNLEMQVVKQLNWDDRSLSYLCRSYDQLYRGQDYGKTLPVIHIGFLDYSPFSGSKEFYSTYKLTNERTGRVYNDKFVLRMVDLTQIDAATDEDKRYRIDLWARIFKATTWEEIEMLTKQDEYLSEAAQALFELNADELTRQRCRAREDYMRLHNTIDREFAAKEALLAEKEKALAENEKALAENEKALAENEKALTEKEKALAENKEVLKAQAQTIAEQNAEIARLKALLAEKSST